MQDFIKEFSPLISISFLHRSNCYSEIRVSLSATGFPNSSGGKESACNAGDPGSIPGLGRSTGEGIGYPLQYSWACLVAQLVNNPLLQVF